MSVYVLLNLLNELRKMDKMLGLPSILSLFRNEFNKFNNTRARNMIRGYIFQKSKMLFLSRRRIPMATLMYEQYIHLR